MSQDGPDRGQGRSRGLAPAGFAGALRGGFTVHRLPVPLLALAVSVMVLVGLLITVLGRRAALSPSPVVAGAAGLASGFMTATAAVGGPALVIYALATRWPQARFAATAQLYFAVLGAAQAREDSTVSGARARQPIEPRSNG